MSDPQARYNQPEWEQKAIDIQRPLQQLLGHHEWDLIPKGDRCTLMRKVGYWLFSTSKFKPSQVTKMRQLCDKMTRRIHFEETDIHFSVAFIVLGFDDKKIRKEREKLIEDMYRVAAQNPSHFDDRLEKFEIQFNQDHVLPVFKCKAATSLSYVVVDSWSGGVYQSWTDFIDKENLPGNCRYCVPTDGVYTPDEQGNGVFEFRYPNADSRANKVLNVFKELLSNVELKFGDSDDQTSKSKAITFEEICRGIGARNALDFHKSLKFHNPGNPVVKPVEFATSSEPKLSPFMSKIQSLSLSPVKFVSVEEKCRLSLLQYTKNYANKIQEINKSLKLQTLTPRLAGLEIKKVEQDHKNNLRQLCKKLQISFKNTHQSTMKRLCTSYSKILGTTITKPGQILVGGRPIFASPSGYQKCILAEVLQDTCLLGLIHAFAEHMECEDLPTYLKCAGYFVKTFKLVEAGVLKKLRQQSLDGQKSHAQFKDYIKELLGAEYLEGSLVQHAEALTLRFFRSKDQLAVFESLRADFKALKDVPPVSQILKIQGPEMGPESELLIRDLESSTQRYFEFFNGSRLQIKTMLTWFRLGLVPL